MAANHVLRIPLSTGMQWNGTSKNIGTINVDLWYIAFFPHMLQKSKYYSLAAFQWSNTLYPTSWVYSKYHARIYQLKVVIYVQNELAGHMCAFSLVSPAMQAAAANLANASNGGKACCKGLPRRLCFYGVPWSWNEKTASFRDMDEKINLAWSELVWTLLRCDFYNDREKPSGIDLKEKVSNVTILLCAAMTDMRTCSSLVQLQGKSSCSHPHLHLVLLQSMSFRRISIN